VAGRVSGFKSSNPLWAAIHLPGTLGFAVAVPIDSDTISAAVSFIRPLGFNRQLNRTDLVDSIGDSAYSASLGWEEGEHHWNLCHPQHILPPGVRLGDGRRRLSSVFKQVAMAAGLRAQILFWSFHGRAKMRGRMPRPARIVPKGDVESRRTLFDIYDPCLSIALRNTCTQ
jgi:hypothetical protein